MEDNSVSDSDSTQVRYCDVCGKETDRRPDGRCKLCMKAYLYEWRKKNPAKLRAINDKWGAANKQKVTDAEKALYARKRGEKILYAKAYYEANKEALKPKKAEWQKNNMDKIVVYCSRRRARKLNNGGELSADIHAKLLVMQKGKCACCGQPLNGKYHLDHIMPLALGGTNSDDNVQLLHPICNNQKAAKHPVDFMQERGFLL